jgi:hypothetical protein
MLSRKLLKRVSIAIAFAALSSLSVVSVGSAQTVPAAGPFVVRIDSPTNGSGATGNITFTGVAADCGTGQPATRVAVYDNSTSGQYLADVSMDTIRQLSMACSGRTGSDRIGFTLILDSRRLSDGHHTLVFQAVYPGNMTATTTADVWADNFPPYGRPCGYSGYCSSSGFYSGNYGANYVGNYGGYYAGSGVVVPGGYVSGGYVVGGYAPATYLNSAYVNNGAYVNNAAYVNNGAYLNGGYGTCVVYNPLGYCQQWASPAVTGYPYGAYANAGYLNGGYLNGGYANNWYPGCTNGTAGTCVLANPPRIVQPCVGAPWRTCVYTNGGVSVQR